MAIKLPAAFSISTALLLIFFARLKLLNSSSAVEHASVAASILIILSFDTDDIEVKDEVEALALSEGALDEFEGFVVIAVVVDVEERGEARHPDLFIAYNVCNDVFITFLHSCALFSGVGGILFQGNSDFLFVVVLGRVEVEATGGARRRDDEVLVALALSEVDFLIDEAIDKEVKSEVKDSMLVEEVKGVLLVAVLLTLAGAEGTAPGTLGISTYSSSPSCIVIDVVYADQMN